MKRVCLALSISVFISSPALLAQTTLQVPGAKLHYTDSGGSGPAVALLHANTGSTESWEKQVPAFAKAGYRVITFDRRGWGKTVVEPGSAPSTAADDLDALRAHLKIERLHVLGTAAGGFIALDYALSYPQHVASLIVAASIGGITDQSYLALGRKLRPSPQFESLPPDVREVGPAYRAKDAAGLARWLELEHTARPEGPRAAAQPLKNPPTYAKLETIRIPTLLISGGADMFAPEPVMRLYGSHIQGAQFLNIPDSGHSIYWEAPEAFNKAATDFWKQHRR